MNSPLSVCDIFESLRAKLSAGKLAGKWVFQKNSYEKDFCGIMGWEHHNKTDYDCITENGIEIEIKKAKSIVWFNLLRYVKPKSTNNLTLVLFYNNFGVQDFALIQTSDIRAKLTAGLKKHDGLKVLEELKDSVPNQLCMQANLTKKQLLSLRI